jgi:hypothetical protein
LEKETGMSSLKLMRCQDLRILRSFFLLFSDDVLELMLILLSISQSTEWCLRECSRRSLLCKKTTKLIARQKGEKQRLTSCLAYMRVTSSPSSVFSNQVHDWCTRSLCVDNHHLIIFVNSEA